MTIIAKHLTSMSQGASVKKISMRLLIEDAQREIEQVPGDTIVLQELVDYVALYRVIVIGDVALPYAFVDRPEWHQPEDWKVSVCLNRTTMLYCTPSTELKRMAERAQQIVGARISFVDIFQTVSGRYTMSEINTACNLSIHEHLAQLAGEPKWNIHYQIARYLTQII
jgi:glutathione synthase/RimK-type ligase-like ATP-grasp enzyme